MINYICKVCGVPFDEPLIRHVRIGCERDEFYKTEREFLCPVCGEDKIAPANYCTCGKPKLYKANVCNECHGDLMKRFGAFLADLTAEQLDELDAAVDGVSLADAVKWL